MKKSAGILLYRVVDDHPEFFLVHPGGPFWKNKDAGAWSVPKGELEEGEEPLDAAIREFREETGFDVDGDFIELTPVKQKSGKLVLTWGVKKDIDPALLVSNVFSMEWPSRSGKFIEIPEVDRGNWFNEEEARNKIIPGQLPIINQLCEILMS